MTKITNSKHRDAIDNAIHRVSDIGPPQADVICLEFGACVLVLDPKISRQVAK